MRGAVKSYSIVFGDKPPERRDESYAGRSDQPRIDLTRNGVQIYEPHEYSYRMRVQRMVAFAPHEIPALIRALEEAAEKGYGYYAAGREVIEIDNPTPKRTSTCPGAPS